MPDVAVFNDRVITVSDVYKFDLDGPFLCLHCDGPLQVRKSRNGDSKFTEHFYHPNTVKHTHVDCDGVTLERLRDGDSWHTQLSNLIESDSREVIRKNGPVKHIVDAYDRLNDMGIEFQHSPISVEAVQSRDATTYLHWVFNVANQYIRKVKIGKRIVCEIPNASWEAAVKVVKNRVYLDTGCREWIYLEDRESYRIEIDKVTRNVWIGTACSFANIYDDTCLQNILTQEGIDYFNGRKADIDTVPVMNARCKKSMHLLDGIHRAYVYKHKCKPNDILAIKSVAGSGKTTTLLDLAKIHSKKKILYLAFNKALIDDIREKTAKQGITNLYPTTFHSLAHRAYVSVKGVQPNIIQLTPQTLHKVDPWYTDKPYGLKRSAVKQFTKFCGSTILSPATFAPSNLLPILWNRALSGQLITHDSNLKMCFANHWLKGYVDSTYDMVMIDETQDFDMLMLRMVLDDMTIPKIFVGDPMQSIYQWRGCINGFAYLPPSALTIEFYSTFRVGDPACEVIRQKFKNCWMISKSTHETVLTSDVRALPEEGYTYLFRSWKKLLTTAQRTEKIWVCNFEAKADTMRKMHPALRKGGGFDDDCEDDLPKFLRMLSEDELEEMIASIEKNSTSKEEAKYTFYTIHSYKGLEDENVRIADDIDDKYDKDKNLYYVALTRGMKVIVEDTGHVDLQKYLRPSFI